MRSTKKSGERAENRLALTTTELQALLGVGVSTALQIGQAAGAKIKIGRRVLWNMAKIREYLDAMSTGG